MKKRINLTPLEVAIALMILLGSCSTQKEEDRNDDKENLDASVKAAEYTKPSIQVKTNQKVIVGNQKSLTQNQRTILSNQQAIIKNQKSILKNQRTLDLIVKNQQAILKLVKK